MTTPTDQSDPLRAGVAAFIEAAVRRRSYSIISAARPGQSEVERASAHAALGRRLAETLIGRPHSITEASAVWQGTAEPSYFVTGLSLDVALALADEFDQEAVIQSGILWDNSQGRTHRAFCNELECRAKSWDHNGPFAHAVVALDPPSGDHTRIDTIAGPVFLVLS